MSWIVNNMCFLITSLLRHQKSQLINNWMNVKCIFVLL